MARNKNRLYIAIYPSGRGENRYHWALMIGPKAENGVVRGQRHHVKNQMLGGWSYASNQVRDVRVTVQLLARVTIAKIEDESRLIEIIQNVPVDPGDWHGRDNGSEPEWGCRIWLLAALRSIRDDPCVLGTNVFSDIDGPEGILETAKGFVEGKIASGRYDSHAMEPKPLLDLMTGKETYAGINLKAKL
ncbi:hypothetical protein N8I77_003328 [Diaporthe amygdali]|uniref:Uncharacterized protein n=1 Tax=Phomopsis amygdali TaxID=1214568 RepID=A0AAD9W7J8_PHOAM|nr:hypothetical protein N8I77_003328 [Diaporthe amygdali]